MECGPDGSSVFRWLPTLLGFPLAGLLHVTVVGSVAGPFSGALSPGRRRRGDRVGPVAGPALARIGPSWVPLTAAGMAVGSAVSAAVTDSGTRSARSS